jgi:hypothetical protein
LKKLIKTLTNSVQNRNGNSERDLIRWGGVQVVKLKVQGNDYGFALRMAKERHRLGYSFQELSRSTGIAVSTLWNWEHAVTVPVPGWRVRALASVFRVTPGYLLDGVSE